MFIYIFQMLCHNTPVYIKKLCNGLLGQPDVVILNPYLNSILMCIFREHKEIHCAVADLQFIFFGICHVTSPSELRFIIILTIFLLY